MTSSSSWGMHVSKSTQQGPRALTIHMLSALPGMIHVHPVPKQIHEFAAAIRSGKYTWEELALDDIDIRLKWAGMFHRRKTFPGTFMTRLKVTNAQKPCVMFHNYFTIYECLEHHTPSVLVHVFNSYSPYYMVYRCPVRHFRSYLLYERSVCHTP